MMLLRLRLRMQRESPMHSGVRIFGDYLKGTARALQAIGESLISGIPARACQETLAASEALTLQLRQETDGLPPSFLAATAKDARFQMDALNGQLRAALDLAAHATPTGQADFVKREAQQPWWLRFSGLMATLPANLNLRSSVFRNAIRLAALIALGSGGPLAPSWPGPFLLPITLVLVPRPASPPPFP